MPVPISPEVSAGPKLSRVDRVIRALSDAVYEPIADLAIEYWKTAEPVSYADREKSERAEARVGDSWGKLWDCAWFHFTGTVPNTEGGGELVLLIDINGEGLVVDNHGDPLLGITSVKSTFDYSLGRPGKRVIPLAVIGQTQDIDIWIDGACNDLFGALQNDGRIEEACIAVRRHYAHSLSFDFEVLRELYDYLPATSARRAKVLQALYNASLEITQGVTQVNCEKASAILAPELAKAGGDPSLTVSALGHAHIDLAWLWPLRETIRKGARTFATVLRMMEKYPDYVFGASQPQLYQWMKEFYPALYAQIKERVAEGRWEIQGAMWVEPDANVPSGESLVRQMLYGKRFFQAEFGFDVKNLWMPDVFGYSGSLPQILRRSGVDYFLTQKLSWSEFNTHPHHTFQWAGIDGTEVLVHMPPEATYNSPASPRAIAKAESQYLENGISDRCLVLFGIGDGGGGPGEEHLERLAREKNLNGLCPVVQEPAAAFFERLAANPAPFPVWRGELYLEKHQGTLTSQARNKRFNRKIEIALRELEFSASQAWRMSRKPYPREQLDRIWKEVLLLQFHDILPGSSITRVYDESLLRYAILKQEIDELLAAADKDWLPASSHRLAVNSLGWDRQEWVHTGESWFHVSVAGLSAVSLFGQPSMPPHNELIADADRLENEFLCVRFDIDGNIVSIFDKEANREVLRPGEIGNDLRIYADYGDAWDFPTDYASVPPTSCPVTSVSFSVSGPLATVKQVRAVGESTLVQEIKLLSGSRRLDFVTRVDWKERDRMLRTCFPVSVNAVSAQCEIQFGSIERPTTTNTSWEAAKSEVCGHKWIDISEPGYGVALLNDCKYGHSVHGVNLDLNLLRGSGWPDPTADRAEHEFTYSLMPHLGDHRSGNVVREAYALNVPLRIVQSYNTERGDAQPMITDIPNNVILETVKMAEDSEEFIVRLYESHGTRTSFTACVARDIGGVLLTDLMEYEEGSVEIVDQRIAFNIDPFEIITLKLSITQNPVGY